MVTFLEIIVFLLSITLILSIILQSGKSAGLSGSVSGGAAILFGGKRRGLDEILVKFTIICSILFTIAIVVLEKKLS